MKRNEQTAFSVYMPKTYLRKIDRYAARHKLSRAAAMRHIVEVYFL